MQYEVRASHILITIPQNASPIDTLNAYKTIKSLRNRVINGEEFGLIAQQFSNDPSAKSNLVILDIFPLLEWCILLNHLLIILQLEIISNILEHSLVITY